MGGRVGNILSPTREQPDPQGGFPNGHHHHRGGQRDKAGTSGDGGPATCGGPPPALKGWLWTLVGKPPSSPTQRTTTAFAGSRQTCGTITTVAGEAGEGRGGAGTTGAMAARPPRANQHPSDAGRPRLSTGNLYVADTANNRFAPSSPCRSSLGAFESSYPFGRHPGERREPQLRLDPSGLGVPRYDLVIDTDFPPEGRSSSRTSPARASSSRASSPARPTSGR